MSKPSHHTHLPHPWHGLEVGDDSPEIVNAFIEITPFDTVKYELDKKTGFLCVDRPQPTSAQNPALYGFIPQTYCGEEVKALAEGATQGDGDPLDICVLSERAIDKNGIIVRARVVGGLQMIDNGEADDKIIAVIEKDANFGHVKDISELPKTLIERIRHYFLVYKGVPGESKDVVSIDKVYGPEHAYKVIEASKKDYQTLLDE